MKRSCMRARRLARSGRGAAFTLIEMLVVMTIILLLAGLILSLAGTANYKGGLARAQGEIQAISSALELYKTDNGAYPDSAATQALDPASNKDPGGSQKAMYQDAGITLYQALSGINSATGLGKDANGIILKSYMTFTSSQTAVKTSGNVATTYIIDPFGLPYGYSDANNIAVQNAAATTPGYNPTFDLWSSAGYGTGAKVYPTDISAAGTQGTLWVKNW